MSKYRVRISDLLENQITGEWGNAPSSNNAIPVIRTTNFCDDGQINFGDIAYRDIPLDKANKKYIKPGDIIIEKSGGTDKKPVGRVVYCENCFEGKKVLCNNFTQILRVNSSVSNPRYVFYLMYFRYNIGIPEHFQNKTTGIRNLQIKAYLDDYVSITDYDEQSRVVSILDHLLALINTRKQQLSKFDELAKSRFIEMFGDPILNPMGWAISHYGDEFEIMSGGTPKTDIPEYWVNGKISWIGSNLCQNSVLIENDGKFITEKGLNNSSAKIFNKGYILIALVGATIGKVAHLKFSTSTNQNIAGINVPQNENYIPEFVFYNTQFLYPKFMDIGNSKFKMANLSFIRSLQIPIVPIKAQKKFSNFVEQLDKSKFRIKKSLEKLEMTYKALLQEYFG